MENNNNNISKSHTASTCVVKVSFFFAGPSPEQANTC